MPKDWFRVDISWTAFRIPIGIAVLAVAMLWVLGIGAPVPRFRLDPDNPGMVVPIHWAWWRRAGDWLHGRRYIVLSFDDGPAPGDIDDRILNVLQANHAKAIFFFVCAHITPNREHVVGDVIREGSMVANHSFTHPHLPQLDKADLKHQVVGCSRYLKSLDGRAPSYFRPPFGETTPAVLRDAREAGMEQVLWADNSLDVLWHKPAKISRWAQIKAYNDTILLMHSRVRTLRALPAMLAGLRRLGYRFVLPERLKPAASLQ